MSTYFAYVLCVAAMVVLTIPPVAVLGPCCDWRDPLGAILWFAGLLFVWVPLECLAMGLWVAPAVGALTGVVIAP